MSTKTHTEHITKYERKKMNARKCVTEKNITGQNVTLHITERQNFTKIWKKPGSLRNIIILQHKNSKEYFVNNLLISLTEKDVCFMIITRLKKINQVYLGR